MIEVIEGLCTGCATCVPVCPEEAISCFGFAQVNDRCTECLICLEFCPLGALEKKKVQREGHGQARL
jgi:ferredoxin